MFFHNYLEFDFWVRPLSKKVRVSVIQDILGHKFPESTQIYLPVHGEDRRRLIASVWQVRSGRFFASVQRMGKDPLIFG